jgi:hypothetical protein
MFLVFTMYFEKKICLCICLSESLFVCTSVRLSVYLPICIFFCLSVHLSVCISVYLPVYLCICLSPCYSLEIEKRWNWRHPELIESSPPILLKQSSGRHTVKQYAYNRKKSNLCYHIAEHIYTRINYSADFKMKSWEMFLKIYLHLNDSFKNET